MKRILIACGALLVSAMSLADECSTASTQTALNACTTAQYQAADKTLNDAYAAVLKRASETQKALLKTAQQKWMALRDADCALMSSGSAGGSIQPMINSQCMTDKTVERTAWLESLLHCDEGDISCPLPPGN